MMRLVAFGLALAAPASALAQEIPPYTMKFEEALSAYGKCVREAVDRFDLSSTPPRNAADGAIAACETAYSSAEAQLTDDFITRKGYSQKAARSSAARNLRPLKSMMSKTALEYVQGKQSGSHVQPR